jgi:hypothetical protein
VETAQVSLCHVRENLGREEADTAGLLAQAFKWHRGRLEVVEGRVAHFGELIPLALWPLAAHPSGRSWAGAANDHLVLLVLAGDGSCGPGRI